MGQNELIMLRKLIDYKKLDHELASLLIKTYPDGYGDEDIIVFKNLNGEIVQAVEVKTEHTIYLVKISKSLADIISNFEDIPEKEMEKEYVTEDFDLPSEELEMDLNLEEEESKHDRPLPF